MALPQMLARTLESVAPGDLPGALARDAECEGAAFHSPKPLLLREVKLHDGSSALLCGTCEGNLAVLTHLLKREDGKVAWPVRREFGNLLRALAMKGWETTTDG